MDKYLFLDIDGVLNHQSWYRKQNKLKEKLKYPYTEFDPKCVERVNRILKETGAHLVISSSWRLAVNLDSIFKKVGLPITFDRTPVMRDEIRGNEINKYLSDIGLNEDYSGYVILDDDFDFTDTQLHKSLFATSADPLGELYKINRGTGLTAKLTKRIIKYLNNKNN